MGESDGYADIDDKTLCRACGRPLTRDNEVLADGCPCNSPRGVNHGQVAHDVCTCVECDPEQTGSSRVRETYGVWFQPLFGLGFLRGKTGEPPWTVLERKDAEAFVALVQPLEQSHPAMKSVEVSLVRRGQRYVRAA